MPLPINVSYTFATQTSTIPLSYLDSNFNTLVTAINGIGNGTVSLSNVSITGGNVVLSSALPANSGGTGLTAPGSSGNVLASNGTAWVSQAPANAAVLTTKGDLLTFSNTQVRFAVGSNGQVLTANSSSSTGLSWANSTVYSTITAGTQLVMNPYALGTVQTQAHGLGAVPNFYRVYIENITAEFNFSTGQQIELGVNGAGGATDTHYVIYSDATNVNITTQATFGPNVLDRLTGTGGGYITPARWKLVIIPYKYS